MAPAMKALDKLIRKEGDIEIVILELQDAYTRLGGDQVADSYVDAISREISRQERKLQKVKEKISGLMAPAFKEFAEAQS